MGELNIEERGTGDPHQFALRGRLSYETAPELRRTLLPLTEEEGVGLLLDLSALEFIDTAGLATLIEAQQRTDGQRGRLVLYGLPEHVNEGIAMARVQDLFTIVETEAEALAALD